LNQHIIYFIPRARFLKN